MFAFRLARINRELVAKADPIASPQRVAPDVDTTEIRVYGEHEQSAYNGHFETTCYHPLLLFNDRGDAAFARPEVHKAHEARQVKYAIRLPANANLERGRTGARNPCGRRFFCLTVRSKWGKNNTEIPVY
jgi:Transposase DDE domain group 1